MTKTCCKGGVIHYPYGEEKPICHKCKRVVKEMSDESNEPCEAPKWEFPASGI